MTVYRKDFLLYLCLIALLDIIVVINAEITGKLLLQNHCVSKLKCGECIRTAKCAWCKKLDFGDRPRCFEPSHVPHGYCPEGDTYNPSNFEDILVHHNLSRARSKAWGGGGTIVSGATYETSGSYSGSESSQRGYEHRGSQSVSASGSAFGSGEIIQLYPQRVSLALRLNEAHRLQMKYSQAEDYPVDLYYLMDLSKSMEDDKNKLSYLGDLLSETMRNMTSNFKLGFGSFVDKVLMPYVSTIPKKLIHPCDGCEAPYGYQNHMKLSTDTRTFSEEVKNAAVSGNLDAPEGGFDAIMQAIVCREQIGWREKARKLLVFSTDAGFHYAGDGKLGGVIEPNDGECHLANGSYTHSTLQDYPSISQINHKVKQNSINIIFAVTSQQYDIYKKLSEHIEGSSAAILSEDSSNVVELVKEEYSKISSSIQMKDNASGNVKVTYYSSCLNGTDPIPTNKCDGLKVGDVVTFTAEITVISCPEDRKNWKQSFQISPIGINESLIVDLEMLCDCECEREGLPGFIKNATECRNHGSLQCGICECFDNYLGKECECTSTQMTSERDSNCRPENATVDCSGRGTCVCGVCQCETRPNPWEKYSGPYCECDNFSCDRHNQLICSGEDHGECICGQCKCIPPWEGNACECLNDQSACIPPGGNETCSGQGKCECGVCKCTVTDQGQWTGKYCETCPLCHGKCEKIKPCVQCQMYKNGDLADPEDCARNCTEFVPVGVETLNCDEENDENYCTSYDEDACRIEYCYKEEDKKLTVWAKQERECPPKVFTLGVVLGVIAAVVLVGLAVLLLWKLFTTIHDRREFARFEKERMMAKWDTGENPIYKQATSTFKNPTYAGK